MCCTTSGAIEFLSLKNFVAHLLGLMVLEILQRVYMNNMDREE